LEVVGLTRSESGSRAVTEAGGRAVRVPGLEREALARAFEGASAVVHLAQIGAERNGAGYDLVNVAGTRSVVDAAAEARASRIVFLSGLGVARYGMARRCTNRYFLSKLAAELELYRSGLAVAVLRPSYVIGHDGQWIPGLLRELAAGELERVGDGAYRMQPIGVTDAAAAILAAAGRAEPGHSVFDLVGPEIVRYQQFLDRLARVAAGLAKGGAPRIREIPVEDADRQAAIGGYRGMLPDELDCLMCDQVGDPGPLERLLGRSLTPLDEVLAAAVRGA
jgi:NADH dehydrogenase